MTTTAVYGVREVMAALKEIEPELRKEALKEIRSAARPMQRAIESRLPAQAPLRGMDNAGRLGWQTANRRVRVKVGGRKSKGRDEWPLVSLALVSAPVSLFDMAGRAGANEFASRLSGAGYGDASRAAWAQDHELRDETQKAILAAIKKMSDAVNQQLVTKGTI